MKAKLSPELRNRVAAMVHVARQRELSLLDMLWKIDREEPLPSKPRIRVKSVSYRWVLPATADNIQRFE